MSTLVASWLPDVCSNNLAAAYYDTITAPTKLRILYKGLVRGKGVFTKASFKYVDGPITSDSSIRQDECILTEVPLVSHMRMILCLPSVRLTASQMLPCCQRLSTG